MLTPQGKQKILILYAVLAFAALVAIVLYFCLLGESPPSDGTALLASVPFIVGRNSLSSKLEADDQVSYDFSSLRASSVNAQFFSVGANNCTAVNSEYVSRTLEQIDTMLRFFEKEEQYVTPAISSSDVHTAKSENKVAGFLSVDGGYTLDFEPSVLRDYYRLGVRSLAIGANCQGPQSSPNGERDGALSLTENEKAIITEMNRLGVLVDLTGSTAAVQNETIYFSTAPVVFSSSSSSQLVPHPWNVDDSVLESLSRVNDGIVMVSLRADQTCQNISDCTTANVKEHIDHIASIVGKNKVGVGGDLDQLDAVYPEGLSTAQGYVKLFDELMADKTWTVSDLQGLAGNNFMRVMVKIENAAQKMKSRRFRRPAFDLKDPHGIYAQEEPSQVPLLRRNLDFVQTPLFDEYLPRYEQKLISLQAGPNPGAPPAGGETANTGSGSSTTNAPAGGVSSTTNAPSGGVSSTTNAPSGGVSSTTNAPPGGGTGGSVTVHLSLFALLFCFLALFLK